MVRSFKVTFSGDRSSKKRKVFHDGCLTVQEDPFRVSLLTEDRQKTIFTSGNPKDRTHISLGAEITLGVYSVNISVEESAKIRPCTHTAISSTPKKLKWSEGSSAFTTVPPINLTVKASKTLEELMKLDRSLQARMMPHQIAGAKFLIEKLYIGPEMSILSSVAEEQSPNANTWTKSTPDAALSQSHGEDAVSGRVAGAILADSMGLGKSLVAICVMWAYICGGGLKAVVVCPASLVDNWKKEITKWMGTRITPVCARAVKGTGSQDAVAATINAFKVAHASRQSVLIINYEQMRAHAPLFQDMADLDMMVCDEGHRLKNTEETQTMKALRTCPACRRLLLTGTPIQNNLSEIYSIADFVSPGILGTLSEFRKRYLCRTNDKSPTSVDASMTDTLKGILEGIMIRRTQAEIADSVLPPRVDVTIYCTLTEPQQRRYDEVADMVSREPCGEILSHLQTLRGICNFVPAGDGLGVQSPTTSTDEAIDFLCRASSKLYVIDKLFRVIKTHQPKEKIVVAANLTSVLDLVQHLCALRQINHLRLDGTTSLAERQPLVNRFNSESDDTSVFLLSTKAGGVGLNLVGSRRLILIDIDWNPATDDQATSRLWRQGQTQPIYIYRLIAANTLEGYIQQRQQEKSEMSQSLLSADSTLNLALYERQQDCCDDIVHISAYKRQSMLHTSCEDSSQVSLKTPRDLADRGYGAVHSNKEIDSGILDRLSDSKLMELCQATESENSAAILKVSISEVGDPK